jgi:RNA polymerase sigma-70 factor (ECF subfamily)
LKLIRFPPRSSQLSQEESVCRTLVETLDALYSTAQHVTGSSGAAEDLVQETARKALEGAASLQHDRNLRAWVFQILLNTIRDSLRRKKLWVEAEIDLESEDLSARTLSLATALDVRNALSALPPPARAVIVLVDIEEFTILEAASILGVAPGTICSRLARARSGLRQHLKVYERRRSGQGGTP